MKFNKKNSRASAPAGPSPSSFKLKVVKPTTPISSLTSYQFECALDTDFLNNLSVQVGVSESSKVTDITDDLKLESFFLQQALAASVAGRGRLEACGRTFSRPPTYHAHLLKTVSHLQRIQKVEEEERKAREASMDAKRQRLLKATAKKVQQDTLQERQKSRSEDRKKLEVIKKKAGKETAVDESDNGDFNVETAVEDIISNKSKPAMNKDALKKPKFTPNPKRQSKDKKFGFGGKDRKMNKRNSKESVNDMTGFTKSNRKSPFDAGVGKKQKSGGNGFKGGFKGKAKGGNFRKRK
jgi:rRNA-processing protein EBP2